MSRGIVFAGGFAAVECLSVAVKARICRGAERACFFRGALVEDGVVCLAVGRSCCAGFVTEGTAIESVIDANATSNVGVGVTPRARANEAVVAFTGGFTFVIVTGECLAAGVARIDGCCAFVHKAVFCIFGSSFASGGGGAKSEYSC